MGFLDDLLQNAGRAGSAVAGPPGSGSLIDQATQNSPIRTHARLMEIENFAREHGYAADKNGLVSPEQSEAFQRDYPDLAAEAQGIHTALAGGIGLSSGMLGSAATARGALTPPRSVPGEVISSRSAPPSSGANPPRPTIDGTVVSASSGPPGASTAAPPSALPAAGGASIPGSVAAGNPNPIGSQGPISSGAGVGPLATIPPTPAAAPPGMLQNIVAWARANPRLAAAAGIATVGAAALTGNAVVNARTDAATQPYGPSLNETTPPKTPEELQREAERQRQVNNDAALTEQQAAKARADAAYADMQRQELEKRMTQSDMTESEKQHARDLLETKIAELNNNAAAARTATEQSGMNTRSAAEIAGRHVDTATTEAGQNTRNTAQIEGRHVDVATEQAGANTRSGYEGQVTQRGQDVQARNAQLQYVVGQAANLVARGQLSEKKAHDMVADYIATQKLPSEILDTASQAIERLLPYRRNGNVGDENPRSARGGGRDLLNRAAGGKGVKSDTYSDFDPLAEAQKWSGGPPTTPAAPIDVAGAYAQGPDTSEAASAAFDQHSAAESGSVPPMIQSLTPPATPPWDATAQQRVYNAAFGNGVP